MKILIIEDNENILRLMQLLLEPIYELYSSADASNGLKLAFQARPEVILLDIMLPGELDGIEFLKIIRSNRLLKDVPVFVISAKASPIDRERAKCAGATEFIEKPFSPRRLLYLIEAVGIGSQKKGIDFVGK